MKKTTLNIHNLVLLWELAGKSSGGFKNGTAYSVSTVENSDWPNRIWVNNTISQATIQDIKSEMNNNNQITFSHFNEENKETIVMHDYGFKIKSLQYGMSLSLNSKFNIENNLILDRVHDTMNAKFWSTAFYEAFRYKIAAETIIKTSDTIEYYLVKNEQILVGTIILFVTNNTVGIHSLGIIPSQRKKGYAREIMNTVLNMAIDRNYHLATLQASEMAKNMYAKMGFSLGFMMENYTLKP